MLETFALLSLLASISSINELTKCFLGSLNCFAPYHSVHGLLNEELCQRSQAFMPTEMAASNLAEPAAFLA